MTDKGLEYLADLHDLRDLNLAESHITDRGVQQLKGLINLRSLALGPAVTSAALPFLNGMTNSRPSSSAIVR